MEFAFDEIKELSNRFIMGFKHWEFGNKAQLAFVEDLYILINDGIPANRAVEMMAQVTTGLTREVALSISQKISEGQPLADGMQDWFAMNVVEIIRVGEEGGALAETMRSAISTMSQRSVAIGSFVSAIAYPLMVIVMACGVMVYLNNTVFVQFRLIKPIEQWPAAGVQLVNLANTIESWWWVALIVIGAFLFVMRRIMISYVGELRPYLDKIPPFSFYRRFASARLLETLGLLVSNGVVFKSAIKIMQYQANPYISSHLIMMEHLLSMGKTNIADVLATGLVDNADLMRLRVMAEVKGFEHGLIRMGVRGAEQATKTMQLIARISGGILLAFGAVLIIIVIRGIYLTGMSMGG